MLRILQEQLTHDVYGAREGFGDIFLFKYSAAKESPH